MKRKKAMRRLGIFKHGLWMGLLFLSLGLTASPADSRGNQTYQSHFLPEHQNEIVEYLLQTDDRYASNRRGRSGGQDKTRERYKEWQKMSPQERERLRRRYEKWHKMPEKDRSLYQRRFEQWKQLSPKDQRRLKQQLDQWDTLSPQEKDRIRRRFRQ